MPSTPVTASDPAPYPKPASGPDLAKAVAAITERIQRARSLAVLPAYTVSRFKLQQNLRALIEALGCPFAAMAMDKGVLSEAHPQFVGTYAGAASSPAVREAVEGADLVIDAGGVSFNDINTAAYSSRIAPERLVTIGIDHVRIGDRIYNPVRMGDVFEMLARSVQKNFGYSATRLEAPGKPGGKPNDPITAAALYPRYRDFLKPRDQIVIESGSTTMGFVPLPLPDGAEVHSQPLWGSIGWATGATLGVALADRSRRTVLFTGEGSHQLTAVDVGTMGRNGLKPIIFVLNNAGYTVERALEANPDWVYNDLAPWNYHALPAALGCQGGTRAAGPPPKSPRSGNSTPPWPGLPRANRRAMSRSSRTRWTSRQHSPWLISASTPCTRTIRAPNDRIHQQLARRPVPRHADRPRPPLPAVQQSEGIAGTGRFVIGYPQRCCPYNRYNSYRRNLRGPDHAH